MANSDRAEACIWRIGDRSRGGSVARWWGCRKSVLESEGRTGLGIVCKKCHSTVCTFTDTKLVEAVGSELEQPSPACPTCGMPLPCGIDSFDSMDALRCPNCDALFEGGLSCVTARSQHQARN